MTAHRRAQYGALSPADIDRPPLRGERPLHIHPSDPIATIEVYGYQPGFSFEGTQEEIWGIGATLQQKW